MEGGVGHPALGARDGAWRPAERGRHEGELEASVLERALVLGFAGEPAVSLLGPPEQFTDSGGAEA